MASRFGSGVGPGWNEPRLYAGYLKDIQRFYEREPLIQVSAQLILSVFTVAFFTFFAIRPTLGTITTLLKKIEDQKEVSSKLDAKMRQLTQAQQILAESGEELEELSVKAVPLSAEISRFIKQIEVLANENGAYITSMDVQGSPLIGNKAKIVATPGQLAAGGGEGERFVTFSFTVGGDQAGVVGFLDDLENMERVVLLTKIGIAKPQSGYRQVFPLTVNGQGTIYYLPAREG